MANNKTGSFIDNLLFQNALFFYSFNSFCTFFENKMLFFCFGVTTLNFFTQILNKSRPWFQLELNTLRPSKSELTLEPTNTECIKARQAGDLHHLGKNKSRDKRRNYPQTLSETT